MATRKEPVFGVEDAIRFLTYPHDGPVTDHVVISRAVEAAATGRFYQQVITEALYIVTRRYAGYVTTQDEQDAADEAANPVDNDNPGANPFEAY